MPKFATAVKSGKMALTEVDKRLARLGLRLRFTRMRENIIPMRNRMKKALVFRDRFAARISASSLVSCSKFWLAGWVLASEPAAVVPSETISLYLLAANRF